MLRVFQKQLCGEISLSQKSQEFVPTRKYAQRGKSIIKENSTIVCGGSQWHKNINDNVFINGKK